ncbi:MAG: retroviral-like aspartic protease family protein [Turicibacter sp.]|nr:retroviral-like aspartic protease family protein [Turicibacter sp.]
MSNFWVELDKNRPWRYVFGTKLWNVKANRYSNEVKVLLDTGSFNTIISENLAKKYAAKTNITLKTKVGGFSGDSPLYIIQKMRIGGVILEKVAAFAVPFDGELKDHILLGANVMNNWNFNVSRLNNRLSAVEEFSAAAVARQYPYRYAFDNKGQVIALQEIGEN